MPRLNNGQELMQYLNSVDKYVIQPTSPGDTTTAAAIAAGAVSVNVTAITGFTAGDPCFVIGDGDVELISAIGTPATTPMPWTNQKLIIPQSSGARFVEAVKIPLGHVTDQGVNWGGTQQLTPVPAATSRTAIAFLKQPGELTFELTLLGHNNLNVQAAFGATEGESGVGSAADPHQVLIGQLTMGTQGVQCLRLTGSRVDLKTVQVDLLNVTIEVSVQVNMGAGQPQGIKIAGRCINAIQRIW